MSATGKIRRSSSTRSSRQGGHVVAGHEQLAGDAHQRGPDPRLLQGSGGRTQTTSGSSQKQMLFIRAGPWWPAWPSARPASAAAPRRRRCACPRSSRNWRAGRRSSSRNWFGSHQRLGGRQAQAVGLLAAKPLDRPAGRGKRCRRLPSRLGRRSSRNRSPSRLQIMWNRSATHLPALGIGRVDGVAAGPIDFHLAGLRDRGSSKTLVPSARRMNNSGRWRKNFSSLVVKGISQMPGLKPLPRM